MARGPVRKLDDDPWLDPFRPALARRRERVRALEARLTGGRRSLPDFASGHEHFGLHRTEEGWVFREWAPNATAISLVGSFSGWEERADLALRRTDEAGNFEVELPADALRHGDLYRLRVRWPGGEGDRVPAWARRVVQDETTHIANAQVWRPPKPWRFRHAPPPPPDAPLVYEAHVGMAQEREGIGTYAEFRRRIVPRIADAGYDTIQLMAVMEHPYYASFGYHVSSYFAASSRFGTPEELKALIDAAHGLGLVVVMDLVHSHAVRNEVEGLSRFDGTPYQFFHEGPRGTHPAWDSRCFDYGKPEVLHFLLSNCRFWLDEYHVDGFRFDGVTSMLYHDRGLAAQPASYAEYFGDRVDEEAVAYLALANEVVHAVRPTAITIAEDVSGMPGLGAPVEDGGLGFDYRLALGVPDTWFRLVRDVRDEDWSVGGLWHELTNRRRDERTIGYVECHDQAIVGGKTLAFELMDAAMYDHMRRDDGHLGVARGVALHKMARLVTLATSGHGYLTFMGNEFGHPEWVDFPREGNGWSYRYARRQWSLRDDPDLLYGALADFDRAMLGLSRAEGILTVGDPELLLAHEADQVLAFARGGLLFLFGFHPDRSLADYEVPAPAGEWELVLDTDEARFGGPARLAPAQRHESFEGPDGAARIRVYLPCRCGMVLRRVTASAGALSP